MGSRFIGRYFAATALAALTLPASAYVVGNGGLTGDIYSAEGASTHRSFAPFFEEVFVDPTLINLTEASTLSGYLSLFGSAAKQQLNVSYISISKSIIPSPSSPDLIATSAAPGYYTFEPLAAGTYYLQVHGQVLLDNHVDYSIRPDWSLGYDMTAFASPVASAAPDAAPLVVTALGLIGVMWRARSKMPSRVGSTAPR